jgi:hypothetical protein
MLPLAQLQVDDLVTVGAMFVGAQALMWMGDRLWKKPSNGSNGGLKQNMDCTIQHAELKSLVMTVHSEKNAKLDRIIEALDKWVEASRNELSLIKMNEVALIKTLTDRTQLFDKLEHKVDALHDALPKQHR